MTDLKLVDNTKEAADDVWAEITEQRMESDNKVIAGQSILDEAKKLWIYRQY